MEHTIFICPKDHDDRGCPNCDGDLQACISCVAFEGMWPDECPGRQMSGKTGDEVYAGRLNYRDGTWFPECCKAMRHVHDTDNYMLENGYFQNEHGQWEKFPVAIDVKVLN